MSELQKVIYFDFIHSRILYGIEIYANTAATHLNELKILNNKPVGELARTPLSFKRPTHHHRTATVPIIRNCHLGIGLRQLLLLPEFKPNELIFKHNFLR